jgi:hypothetical protein
MQKHAHGFEELESINCCSGKNYSNSFNAKIKINKIDFCLFYKFSHVKFAYLLNFKQMKKSMSQMTRCFFIDFKLYPSVYHTRKYTEYTLFSLGKPPSQQASSSSVSGPSKPHPSRRAFLAIYVTTLIKVLDHRNMNEK